MKVEKIKIDNIPTLVWGEKSEKVFIAIHGNMSYKDDEVIKIFANNIINKGYQLISFDLPEHGDRKEDKKYLCKVQNCIKDLEKVINYAKTSYKDISIFACSIGAYFSLLAYKNEIIKKCLFLSPIVNMKILIDNMMIWNNTTEKELEKKLEINTDFGQTLYWDYYCYVKNNPIKIWNKETYILYGNKDNMQEKSTIKNFAKEYNCKLDILDNAEHYFHTKEQLDYFKYWLDSVII